MSVDFAATTPGSGLASTMRRGGQDTRGFSQDVNGFWQEVFDAARVVPQERLSPEAAQPTRYTTRGPQPFQIEGTQPPEKLAVAGPSVSGSAKGTAQAQTTLLPTGRTENTVPHTSLRAGVVASATRPAVASVTVPWTPLPDEPSQAAPMIPITRLWQTACAAETAPSEAVSVHMTAEGIELHVRSPGIDAPEAIRYAREVARHLAGSASQLRLLVLNGATVYAASLHEAPIDDPMLAGLLNIRC